MAAGMTQPECQDRFHRLNNFVGSTCPSKNKILIEPGMPAVVVIVNGPGARLPWRAIVYRPMSLPTAAFPLSKSAEAVWDSKGKLSVQMESAIRGVVEAEAM